MDAKTYPNLDPKLKETYDRIMGTATAKSHPQQGTHSTAHQTPPGSTAPAHPLPSHEPSKEKHTDTPQHHLSHLAYTAGEGEKSSTEKHPDSLKHSLVIPIIVAVCGVVFFVLYSLFWVNFFGMR